MKGLAFRKALHAGTRVYGTTLTAPSPLYLSIVARAGLDFVFIDTEHICLDRQETAWFCRAIQGMGRTPVVRVPKADASLVVQAVDAGAGGIVIPYVEDPAVVREIGAAIRYRPLKGRRLTEAASQPGTLNQATQDYLQSRNGGTSFLINVESTPAMECLSELLEVPELDGVLIGPHDLSCSLGMPEDYQDPRFRDAVRHILGEARRRGLGAGIHMIDGDLEAEIEYARAGANILLHSADLLLFSQALQSNLGRLRSALEDGPATAGEGGPDIV